MLISYVKNMFHGTTRFSKQVYPISTKASAIRAPAALKSSLFIKSNDLGGYYYGPVKDMCLTA